jgi:hypothetical protein
MRYLGFMVLAAFMVASSCITQKRCLRRFPPGIDTVKVTIIKDTVILRDTTVYIHLPGEIRIDSVVIPCPAPPDAYIPDTVRAETSLAVAFAWWKYPRIHLQLVQKDTTIEQRLQDAIREKIHWQSEYERIREVQVKKEIPGIFKIAIGGWIGVIIFIIFILVIRLMKPL